jgi:hypothetical protein
VRLSLAMLGLFLVACGQNSRDPRCPATPPPDGASCSQGNTPLACEYSTDVRRRATTKASCVGSEGTTHTSWLVSSSPIEANSVACPGSWTESMRSGSCATDVNLVCEYDEGRCGCVCNDTTVWWDCRARTDVSMQGNGTCPSQRPLAGDACSDEGLQCYYAAYCGSAPLSFGFSLQCDHGYWAILYGTGACPVLNCAGWSG